MKRMLAASLAAFLAVTPSAAQPALVPAAGLARIGVAAAVRGPVKALAPGQAVGRVIESGRALYVNDHVVTGPDSRLQILLLDQTTFTIGPNSDLVLDEFVYDPKTNAGKLSARMVKGVFRFVTGKIAKKHPDDVRVKVPTGTIGIRGTMVAGMIEGGRADVALLGPGPANDAREPVGGITISNDHGQVDIDRGGFYTSMRADAPPTPPAPVSAQEMQGWMARIDSHEPGRPGGPENERGERGAGDRQGPRDGERMNGEQGRRDGQGRDERGPREGDRRGGEQGQWDGEHQDGEQGRWSGDRRDGDQHEGDRPRDGHRQPEGDRPGGERGGQYRNGHDGRGPGSGPAFSAGDFSGENMASGDARSALISSQIEYAQHQAAAFAAQDQVSATAGLPDSLSSWDQVRAITAGTGKYVGAGSYVCSGGPCGSSGTGGFQTEIAIDFGQRTIGGGSSNISLTAGSLGTSITTGINAVSYAGLPDLAALDLSHKVTNAKFVFAGIALSNSDDGIASDGLVGFSYSDTSASVIAEGRAATDLVVGH